MTREYILLNLEGACPIWFMDEPALRDEVMSTLQDSLLIPKPKFKVGDKVTIAVGIIIVDHRHYDIDNGVYLYGSDEFFDGVMIHEDDLELVEAVK